MANSDLYGKTVYRVPDGVLAVIKDANQRNPGNERAQHLLASPKLSYENAKRIKNFLEVTNASSPQYTLAGGRPMLDWLNKMLNQDRKEIVKQKTVKSNSGFENQFRTTHERTSLKPTELSVSRFKPEKPKAMSLFEAAENGLPATATVGVIVRKDLRFLLVKRADHDDWMPGKWALPGGGIDAGEDVETALRREMMEETNLQIEALKTGCGVVRKDGDNMCAYVLAYCPDPSTLKLDENEHSEAQWVTLADVASIDCVPDLAENVQHLLDFTRKKEAN
jgi:8-oxo-dGTP diphosphatase